jgi:hypothetical protein
MSKGHRQLLIETAKTLKEFLQHHQISAETLGHIAGLDNMRIRRFVTEDWTRGPAKDFFDKLLSITERLPTFWPDDIRSLLKASRDYYAPLGI